MQQFSGKKNVNVGRKTVRHITCLAVVVLAMLLSGCAAKTVYKFSAKSVTNVSYNPKDCTETFNGKFRCKDVIFTVATIEPVKDK